MIKINDYVDVYCVYISLNIYSLYFYLCWSLQEKPISQQKSCKTVLPVDNLVLKSKLYIHDRGKGQFSCRSYFQYTSQNCLHGVILHAYTVTAKYVKITILQQVYSPKDMVQTVRRLYCQFELKLNKQQIYEQTWICTVNTINF